MPLNIRITPLQLAAAEWKVRVEGEGPEYSSELNAWLRQSVEHKEAYLRTLIIWDLMTRVASKMKVDVDKLVREYRITQSSDGSSRPHATKTS
jgi:ferric-dicitrate binding protein FerR (iron transport regulator)